MNIRIGKTNIMNIKIAGLLLVLSLGITGCQSAQPADAAMTETKPEPVKPAETVQRPTRVDSGSTSSYVAPVETVDPYQSLLEVRTLFFDFDRSELRSTDQAVVAAHARFLRENPGTRIRLEGHADERGSREYNIGLGERRAQTVRRNLALQGAGSDQLDTRSYGEEKPLASDHTESAWQLNRRVELVYY
ncbi:MAG: peptidoglycan-associated lipoprotein Pal [Gammaproteobacteria bacterium]